MNFKWMSLDVIEAEKAFFKLLISFSDLLQWFLSCEMNFSGVFKFCSLSLYHSNEKYEKAARVENWKRR